MHISVVLGTAREGRSSEKVARFLFNTYDSRQEHSVEYIDVRDCLSTFATQRYAEGAGQGNLWHDAAYRSDGFIFVIPEYNHGYPGEWKLLIDSLYKTAYLGKVAGLVGVSNGQFGGVRALELSTLSLSGRGMYVMKNNLHFPFVETQFTEDEGLVHEAQRVRSDTFLEEFSTAVSKFR